MDAANRGRRACWRAALHQRRDKVEEGAGTVATFCRAVPRESWTCVRPTCAPIWPGCCALDRISRRKIRTRILGVVLLAWRDPRSFGAMDVPDRRSRAAFGVRTRSSNQGRRKPAGLDMAIYEGPASKCAGSTGQCNTFPPGRNRRPDHSQPRAIARVFWGARTGKTALAIGCNRVEENQITERGVAGYPEKHRLRSAAPGRRRAMVDAHEFTPTSTNR